MQTVNNPYSSEVEKIRLIKQKMVDAIVTNRIFSAFREAPWSLTVSADAACAIWKITIWALPIGKYIGKQKMDRGR